MRKLLVVNLLVLAGLVAAAELAAALIAQQRGEPLALIRLALQLLLEGAAARIERC